MIIAESASCEPIPSMLAGKNHSQTAVGRPTRRFYPNYLQNRQTRAEQRTKLISLNQFGTMKLDIGC